MKLVKVETVEMPAWPYGLSAPLAAAYCGVSLSNFRQMVQTGSAPKPVHISPKRVVWRQTDLRAWLDGLAESEQKNAFLGTGGAFDQDRIAIPEADDRPW